MEHTRVQHHGVLTCSLLQIVELVGLQQRCVVIVIMNVIERILFLHMTWEICFWEPLRFPFHVIAPTNELDFHAFAGCKLWTKGLPTALPTFARRNGSPQGWPISWRPWPQRGTASCAGVGAAWVFVTNVCWSETAWLYRQGDWDAYPILSDWSAKFSLFVYC